MPRVSQEHLDARRRQILDAARRCFVRNGFHATSMQDILGESGLSAGATYRYFRSKDEIVQGLAAETLDLLLSAFDTVDASDPPLPLAEALEQIAQTFERLDDEADLAKMVVQLWGEVMRAPELRARMSGLVATLRDQMTRLVEDYQARGEIGPGDPREIAKVTLSLMPGFILQRAIFGDLSAQSFGSGLRSLLREGKVTHR